jgi:hypothetical protein
MTTPELSHQINLALRTAAGHARAARDVELQADKTYEMKMRSAGAAVYEAWGLAVRSQPEYHGRKIDDRALRRIYESTKARPWWDRCLAAVKVEGKPATRDWAKRTMQWHLDPDAARARRAQGQVRSAAHHKRVKAQAAAGAASWGGRTPQAEPTTAQVRAVAKAAELGMGYGSCPAVPGREDAYAAAFNTGRSGEIIRLLERAKAVVAKMNDQQQLAEAESATRDLVEVLENL